MSGKFWNTLGSQSAQTDEILLRATKWGENFNCLAHFPTQRKKNTYKNPLFKNRSDLAAKGEIGLFWYHNFWLEKKMKKFAVIIDKFFVLFCPLFSGTRPPIVYLFEPRRWNVEITVIITMPTYLLSKLAGNFPVFIFSFQFSFRAVESTCNFFHRILCPKGWPPLYIRMRACLEKSKQNSCYYPITRWNVFWRKSRSVNILSYVCS